MITEALLGFFFLIVRAIALVIPDGGAPGWLDDGAGQVSELVGKASGLGAWFPFTLAATVLAAVLTCVVVGFTIKIVRIVASFLTAGGGSAA